jgi:stage IV sporulation protein A
MNRNELLANLATRGNGDVYLGVVGPVRTGKSTFVKKFMELAIIPNIDNDEDKKRAIDELPISGEGKMITTMEPKFVPNKGIDISIEDIHINTRIVDCVGYVIKDAKGYEDENGVRMVKTPWYEDAIPFDEAAKIGTQKVITDHSTIGVVIVSDGTILDIPKENYLDAEKEVIDELIKINKPFVIIVNSKDPEGEKATNVVSDLIGKYNVPVIPLDVTNMNQNDIDDILKSALYEFPISNIEISMPSWVNVLDETHWLRESIDNSVKEALNFASKIKDVDGIKDVIKENENIKEFKISEVDMSIGLVKLEIDTQDDLYESVLKEIMGFDIDDPMQLLKVMQEYAKLKKDYEYVSSAIEMAMVSGYGFATPGVDKMNIEKPELIKQGNRYGVKVKASAPTLHIIKVDVETTFSPLIGLKEQSESLVEYLSEGMDEDSRAIFDKQIFGQNMGIVLQGGISGKLTTLPENTKVKLQNLMKTISNKGKNNIIAVVF